MANSKAATCPARCISLTQRPIASPKRSETRSVRRYSSGWYPTLFYKGRTDSGKYDALFADVHANVPAPVLGDPGGVVHQGVGRIDFGLIAIDNGRDRMVYAGPMLSHYEFVLKGVKRKSDSEWKANLKSGRIPSRPSWTRSYLVPR